MSNVGDFLPFIILLILLGFIVLVVVLLNRERTIRTKFVYGKRIRWTIAGYVAVLLLATGVFFLIPEPETSHGKHVEKQDDGWDGWEVAYDLADAAYEGKLTDAYDQYIVHQWDLEQPSDSIRIEYHGDSEPVTIYIEKKDENDDVTEATFYRTPTIIDGQDVTDQIPAVRMKSSPGKITFINPERTKIEFTTFKKEFPITQFTGGSDWMNEYIQRGGQAIYLQVPKDIELEYEEYLDVVFVGG